MVVYPGAFDAYTPKVDHIDLVMAQDVNELQDGVEAIEPVLGTNPQGTAPDVKTRLARSISNDGYQIVAQTLFLNGGYGGGSGITSSLTGDLSINGNLTVDGTFIIPFVSAAGTTSDWWTVDIDDSSATTQEFRFGVAGRYLRWNKGTSQFEFSANNVYLPGVLTVTVSSGTTAMSISSSSTAAPSYVIQITKTGVVAGDATAVYMSATGATGTTTGTASYANSAGTYAFGLFGQASGTPTLGVGVYGLNDCTGTQAMGVQGISVGNATTGYGGYFLGSGVSTTNYGVYAVAQNATTNWAGYFGGGNFYVQNQALFATSDAISTTTARLRIQEADSNYNYTGSIAELSENSINASDGTGILGAAQSTDGTGAWVASGVVGQGIIGNNNAIVRGIDGRIENAGAFINNTAYAVYGNNNVTNTGGTNYGLYGAASGALYNWAGYFGTGNVFVDNVLLVNDNTALTDFPNAQAIITQADSSVTQTNNIGLISESVAGSGRHSMGLYGIAKTNGVLYAYGVSGQATVTNTADTGQAIGVKGASVATHAGGENYGVFGDAENGAINYAIYGNSSGTGTNYSGYFAASGVASTNYGVYATVIEALNAYGIKTVAGSTNVAATNYGGHFSGTGVGASINYGLYATASGATTNWAGYFQGNVNINGKLTVTGMIDPTALILSPTNPAPSSATGTIYYDSIDDKFYFRQFGAWAELTAGAGGAIGENIYSETPTPAPNGIIVTFNTSKSYITNSLQVYLNGQRMTPGALNDYTETTDTSFTMTFAPSAIDVLYISYAINGIATTYRYCEIPTPVPNGVQLIFTTPHAFRTGTLKVFVNGMRQKNPDDYSETAINQFTMTYAPVTGTTMLCDYDSSSAGAIIQANDSAPALTVAQNGSGKIVSFKLGTTEWFYVDNSGNTWIGGKLTVVGAIDPTYLGLTPGTAPGSPADGQIYYNTADAKFKFRQSGAWVELGGGGGGSPGGLDKAVQFNNASSFGGNATAFAWDNANTRLTITGLTDKILNVVSSCATTGYSAVEIDRSGNCNVSYGLYVSQVGGTVGNRAIWGLTAGTGTSNQGVRGTANGIGTNNYGIYGEAQDAADTTGKNYGGYFSANSGTHGPDTNYGIYSVADGDGITTNYGIYSEGKNHGASNWGGYFSATGTSGTNTGVNGYASGASTTFGGSFSATGISPGIAYGIGAAVSGADTNYGVYSSASGASNNYAGYFFINTGSANVPQYAGYFTHDSTSYETYSAYPTNFNMGATGVYIEKLGLPGIIPPYYNNAGLVSLADEAVWNFGVVGIGKTNPITSIFGVGVGVYGTSDVVVGGGAEPTYAYGVLGEIYTSTANVADVGVGVLGKCENYALQNYGIAGNTYDISGTHEGTGALGSVCFADSASGTIYGVWGSAYVPTGRTTTGTLYGVYGEAIGPGTSTINYGGYFTASGATTNWAGYFVGNVNVTGTLSAGGIAGPAAGTTNDTFTIDTDDTTTTPALILGNTYNKKLTWNNPSTRFELNDKLYLADTPIALTIDQTNASGSTYYGLEIVQSASSTGELIGVTVAQTITGNGDNICYWAEATTSGAGATEGFHAELTAGTACLAVYGKATGSADNWAIYGYAEGNANPGSGAYGGYFSAVSGTATANYGIYAIAGGGINNYAGYFTSNCDTDLSSSVKVIKTGTPLGSQYGLYADVSGGTISESAIYATASGAGQEIGLEAHAIGTVAGTSSPVAIWANASGSCPSAWGLSVSCSATATIANYGAIFDSGGITPASYGVWTRANGASGATTNNYGIYSIATGPANFNYSGYFACDGATAPAVTGFNYGIYSITTGDSTKSVASAGVWSVVDGTSPNSIAVFGQSTATGTDTWAGGFQNDGGGTNSAQGCYAQSIGVTPTGYAFNGYVTAATTTAYGIKLDVSGARTTSYGVHVTCAGATTNYSFYGASGTMLNLATYSDVVGGTNRDMYIDNTGKFGYVVSSIRYKENVIDMENLDWLYQLRPVNFSYKNDPDRRKQYGLIAEEVDNINNTLVTYNEDGTPETVSYSKLIPILLKAIQDQKAEIELLKAKLL